MRAARPPSPASPFATRCTRASGSAKVKVVSGREGETASRVEQLAKVVGQHGTRVATAGAKRKARHRPRRNASFPWFPPGVCAPPLPRTHGGDGIRSRFLLVVDDDADSSIKEAAKQLAGSFSEIVELRVGPCHDMTLVRPDGYIAYSAHNSDGIAALKSVGSLLERQTH